MAHPESRRLLIVSCSQRKRSDPGHPSALERYDGVNFRVVRKAMREGRWHNTDLLILSARYGLIDAGLPIEDYDQRMTRARAIEIRQECFDSLATKQKKFEYQRIFVNLGKDYLPAIDGLEKLVPENADVEYAHGGMGNRLKQMKTWINQVIS